MSLDVYLYNDKDEELSSWNKRKQESIEQAGSMIGLLPMINEYYDKRKPEREYIYNDNITHNLTAMADLAGLYKPLWRPEELQVTTAKQLIPFLKAGLAKLASYKEEAIQLTPENNWGSYSGLKQFVEEYLVVCEQNPDAIIEVSR